MAMTLKELAEALGAELVGGPEEAPVLGVCGLDNPAPGHIAYVDSPRRLAEAEAGPLLAALAPPELEPGRKPLLRVANPRLAYARALRLFSPPRRLPPGVHPTAHIGPGVMFGDAEVSDPDAAARAASVAVGPLASIGAGTHLGADTQVHALVAIGEQVRIGPGCDLQPRVVIHDGVTIGARCIIQAGAVVGSAGFGYADDGRDHVHLPHIGTVVVEDDVEIGANTTIDRATTGATVIGQGTKVDNLVHIAHNVVIGRRCLLAGQVGISGSVTIGDDVILAGQAGVVDHVTIGDGARAGARSAIIHDIPAGAVVWGSPSRPRAEQLRLDAAAGRLPELLRTVRDLARRLEALEKRIG